MGLQEDALRQVIALDAGRSAQLSLRVAQNEARGESGAILAIEGDAYIFFATAELAQADTQRIDDCWRASRDQLLGGEHVIGSDWIALPLGRPTVGVLYIGRAKAEITPELRQRLGELGQMFEVAIAMREQESEIHLAFQAMIERTPLRLLTREKLLAVLRYHRGNKSRVAKELQITRATLYRWMASHGLDSAEF